MIGSDKDRFEDFALHMSNRLRALDLPSLRIECPPRIKEWPYSDEDMTGYYATIGRLDGLEVALSQDNWRDGTLHKFWIGFKSEEKQKVVDAAECLPEEMAPRKFYLDTPWVKDRVKGVLLNEILGGPIVEYYDEKSWLGIYMVAMNVDDAVAFTEEVALSVNASQADGVRELASDEAKETVRKQLISARVGQDRFRADLMIDWGGACAVTGCEIPEMLRASHIVPWNECAENQNRRLDKNNGLLLTANLDALFDKHLISFDDDGCMVVSNIIRDDQVTTLRLGGCIRKAMTVEQRSYLSRHRKRVATGRRVDKGDC